MTSNLGLLPRELVPGLVWLGDCLKIPYEGEMLHSYDSAYLVRGTEASLLVDAGMPLNGAVMEAQLVAALQDAPPLRYVFLTHQETPHAGGIGRLMALYPELVAIGDVRDFHLFFPQYADRFRTLLEGESVDLGGTEFRVLAPVIRDLITTRWGFATAQRTLFTADGYAYTHHHRADECGKTAEEVPSLSIAEMNGLFIEQALHWTRFVDVEPYIDGVRQLVDDLDVAVIAPTHGLPVTDVEGSLAEIAAGLRSASGVK